MLGEDELRQMASWHGGHVSSAQVRSVGLPSGQFARLAGSDRWTPVTPRVLRLAGAPVIRGERLHAAVLDQGGDAATAAEAAAWWWGLPGFSARSASLVTTSSTTHRTSLASVTQITSLPSEWVTELDHLRVVRPEFMILQLCARLHPDRAERALDNAWRDRLLSGRSIDEFLDQLGRRGRDGVALLRELRAARPDEYTPPASNLERRATDVLAPLGLDLVRQVDSGGERWTGRVDLRARRLPVLIEIQSEKYHTALLDIEADTARRDALEDAGFVVVEITDEELWTAPAVARQRVTTAVAPLRAGRVAG